MTWQTIDSAPKDGTRILVVCKQSTYANEPAIAYWDSLAKEFLDDSGDIVFEAFAPPLYWQPLPEPPK
jgi:hypothetical protein